MIFVALLACLTMVLAPRGEVAQGPENRFYLEEGKVENPRLDSAVDRAVRHVNKEKQRRNLGKRKNAIKSKKIKLRKKIKISKHITNSRYIHQSKKENKTKNGNKKAATGKQIAFAIVEKVFDSIKLYNNYQNALRKGKRTATWFRMLKQKEKTATNNFKNASEALEHATRNGTKCGNSPLSLEAKKAVSILRNCAGTASKACSSGGIKRIMNTTDCSVCDAVCTSTDCTTTTCTSTCTFTAKEETLNEQLVTDFENDCEDELDAWTSGFKDCIFTKTFKLCSTSCLSDSDRWKCNLNECKKTNCKNCDDCDACSLEKCLVGCSTDKSCLTECKTACLEKLPTVTKFCKTFGKTFESVTKARKLKCKGPNTPGNFLNCRLWTGVVPFYTKKCCDCSVPTKAPSGRRSQYLAILKDLKLK